MDRRFQDISIVDKHFRDDELVIPRGSQIMSISFKENYIIVFYVDSFGYAKIKHINYELLENGRKLVID